MIKSIPFGKYRRYSITFGYVTTTPFGNYGTPETMFDQKKLEKDQEHK
jgi:hypothetical protein